MDSRKIELIKEEIDLIKDPTIWPSDEEVVRVENERIIRKIIEEYEELKFRMESLEK